VPVFVHLTRHDNVAAIRRGGIAPGKLTRQVYAMPVTRNFQISHQWLRELRGGAGGTMVAVYFRVPDDEAVEIGHYGSPRQRMTAAQAVAIMLAAETVDPTAARAADDRSRAVKAGKRLPSSPEGFEVLLSRRIQPSEILRVKAPPQVVGWRRRPGSNGAPPCLCICCERGRPGVGKLLRSVEEAEAKGRPVKATVFGRDERSFARVERLKAARTKD